MQKQQENLNEDVPWRYQGRREFEIPSWAVGFTYILTHKIPTEGRYMIEKIYVGKKLLVSSNRKKIGVREKAATKTRKRFKTVTKDSNWKDYWSSSDEVKKARKTGIGTWQRTIIEWCHSKKYLSYAEMKLQCQLDVLGTDTYNANILSRWFRKDLIKPTNTQHDGTGTTQ
jgi:hypothetical protein